MCPTVGVKVGVKVGECSMSEWASTQFSTSEFWGYFIRIRVVAVVVIPPVVVIWRCSSE